MPTEHPAFEEIKFQPEASKRMIDLIGKAEVVIVGAMPLIFIVRSRRSSSFLLGMTTGSWRKISQIQSISPGHSASSRLSPISDETSLMLSVSQSPFFVLLPQRTMCTVRYLHHSSLQVTAPCRGGFWQGGSLTFSMKLIYRIGIVFVLNVNLDPEKQLVVYVNSSLYSNITTKWTPPTSLFSHLRFFSFSPANTHLLTHQLPLY